MAAVQQLGPGVEPHVLLELHEARRAAASRPARSPTRSTAIRLASTTFIEKFTEAATTQFGSGWAWLVDDGRRSKIMKTANADLPMKHGAKALLTIDVWEHAYYIDYRNARPKYIETFLDHLVNWDFVAENLAKA